MRAVSPKACPCGSHPRTAVSATTPGSSGQRPTKGTSSTRACSNSRGCGSQTSTRTSHASPRSRFICEMRDVDVKAPGLLDKPGAREALAWTADVAHARGWRYQVWTSPDLVVLGNVRTLAAARRPRLFDPIDVTHAVRLCGDGARFADLELLLAQGRTGASPRLLLFRALWSGELRCDMSTPLAPETWLEPAA